VDVPEFSRLGVLDEFKWFLDLPRGVFTPMENYQEFKWNEFDRAGLLSRL